MYTAKRWFQSRKFWLAVAAAGTAFANEAFGWGLEVEQVGAVLIPVVAYIFGQSFVDVQQVKQEGETLRIIKEGEVEAVLRSQDFGPRSENVVELPKSPA